MANVKISELTALSTPDTADEVPVVDVSADVYAELEAELAKPVQRSTLLPWESEVSLEYQ